MKTIFLFVLAAFLLSGISGQDLSQMTIQQQETAKSEIREAVRVIFQNLQGMDADALFQSYSNSPGLIFFTTEGSMVDLQQAKYHHAEWFKSLSSLKVTTITDDFRFLPCNTVICAWQGKFEMMMGSGQRLLIDRFGITFIFSKINNEWKVIYQHSSALPPVPDMPVN